MREFRNRAGLVGLGVLPIVMAATLAPSRALNLQAKSDRQISITKEQAAFPHSKEKHRTLECSKCHKIEPGNIDETRFTGHATCLGCHNLAVEALMRPVTFCGICHSGRPISKQQSALFKAPKRTNSTDFGTAFSHPAHLKPRPSSGLSRPSMTNPLLNVSVLGGATPRCDDCHKANDAKAAVGNVPEINSATGHPSCFVCHGDQPIAKPAMSQCGECHKLSGPRYPHYYGTVRDFKHPDHTYDTRPIIKAEVRFPRAPDYLCSECHQSAVRAASLSEIRLPQVEYCNQCHNGRIGLPDPLSKQVTDSLRR